MKAQIPILMNLYRGGAAIVLGILLLFIPDVSRNILFNLMGFFWLTVGLGLLRRTQDDERNPGRHTAVLAGIVGIITGLLVVTRRFTSQWVAEETIFFVLGTVILVTGLMHMIAEARLGTITTDRQTGVNFVLGFLEVVLGALLLLTPKTHSPLLYWAATAWALIYGVLFIGMGVYQYRQRKQTEASSEAKLNQSRGDIDV